MTEDELRDLSLYNISVILIERVKEKGVLTPGLIKEIVSGQLGNPVVEKSERKYEKAVTNLLIDVDYFYDLNKEDFDVEEGISLNDPGKHIPWDLPTSWYYWDKHRDFIISEYKKKDPDNWGEIVKSLDDETDDILSSIESPLRAKFDSHGLVIGYVQSGKTANFTALIAKAMDCGYQLIIILAGMHNTLRVQTQARLDRELLGYDDLNTGKPNIASHMDKKRLPRRATTTQYTDSFDEKVADGEFHSRVTKLDELIVPQDRYNKVTAVVKKNVQVLRKLNSWIEACPKKTRRSIPLLVIDDEADQASVDANYLINRKKNRDLQENATKTNQQITTLLSKFDRSAYIGYTATPFANCFIDPSYENLYPKNLIHFLPKPEAYFGAQEIFDNEKLKDAYVITKDIESKDDFFDTLARDSIPESLEGALYTFFVSMAVRVLRGESEEPMSMLVHITHTKAGMVEVHNAIERRLKALRGSLGKKTSSALKTKEKLKSQWLSLKKSGALINSKTGSDKRSFFNFEKIYKVICEDLSKIELRQVHSGSEDELDYAKDPSLRVIAVGGNKLSRGLTLEGLLTTFFLRSTNNADTLMQMGRFFGYRRDYHDLMRVYCTEQISTDFEYLIALESDLRSEVSRYRDEGLTPLDFAPAVRTHTRMRPSGRMGNARVFRKNLGASIIQTKYFKLRDIDFLEQNNEIVENFVSRLVEENNGKPGKPLNSKSPGKVFYGIDIQTLIVFLGEYRLAREDFSAQDVITYMEKRKFRKCNIGIADLKKGKKTNFGDAGSFHLVERSRKSTEYSGGFFNIGVLTEQRHLIMDLEAPGSDPTENRKLPLLVLYRIDGDSKAKSQSSRLDLFEGLGCKTDISCFGIVMPRGHGEEKDVWGQDL
jgi:hypothetical protein